ncbi:MAG: class I SAM-dependent methyltransferase [bacterium]
MRADAERWNHKYLKGDGSVSLRGEPELVRHHRSLPQAGLALELACGKGANALYLASLGLDVVAVDASIEGLKICRLEADRLRLNVLPLLMDLDHYSLPAGRFALISVVRYLDRALFSDLVTALMPGGVLFYKTFNLRHLRNKPGFNPAFVLKDGELDAAFDVLDIIAHSEEGTSSFVLGLKT